ncbi:MAG TPA: hypothetical protein VMX38_01325 [Verrucomicrobiae bacterium]|nr:hypothetical protein [Verrucomicrobiae bacterium]
MQTRDETLNYLKAKRQSLMDEIAVREKTLEHLNATIRLLEQEPRETGIVVRYTPQSEEEFPLGKLKRLTQVQAVVAIAKHYGGVVKAQDAKHLMIRAGVMRNTKNSTNITHNVITRSGQFERIAPGEYRLKQSSVAPKEGIIFETPLQ